MQLHLFGRQMHAELARTEHGGDVRRGCRKLERPVSTRRPMHLVLTTRRARGRWSLRKHDRVVREALRRMARRFEVRIYDFANVGTHLHLVLRARRREGFQGDPTPCVVTLPYGDYELLFKGVADPGRTGAAMLHVRTETVVLKHTLGQVRHARGQVMGGALLLTGTILLAIAASVAASPEARSNGSTTQGMALAGVGGIALGGVVLLASPTTRQEGSASQWNPFPAPPIVGMSLGAKF